jgi:hypothetical protein
MRLSLHIFNAWTRFLWIVLAVTTVISEVVPIPHMNPILHYGVYSPSKLVCFLLIGFFTPLAFARLNALSRGIGFATVCATVVEALQGLIGNGHSFHSYELAVKLTVILFGFMLGLEARYEGALTLGILRIVLIPDRVRRRRAVKASAFARFI